MMFCTILALVTVPIAYVTNKLIDYLYSDMVKANVAYYGWYVLEFCSKVEMKSQQAYRYAKQYFPAINKKKEDSFITLVKDGEEISKYEFNEFMKLKEEGKIITGSYDFILYEVPITDNDKYDRYIVRYNQHIDIIEIEYNALNEFNFNVMQFKFKNTDVTYNMHFNKNLFMMNNNILFDRDFLKWYMNKYHNAIVQNEDKYTVSFIDHTMSYTILTENDYIVIKNKSYDTISGLASVVAVAEAVESTLDPQEKKDQ